MEARKNANYEIIATVRVSSVQEIVIGRNRVAPDPYVCWYCLNGDDYFLGQYRGSYEAALKVMAERINIMGKSISDSF